MSEAIRKAIEYCKGQDRLAKACGVKQQSVAKWLKGAKMDTKYIERIIKATNGKVTAEEIRPDVDWAVIKGESL
ncbi:transcriptional regulator [Pasteurella sp. PK-2025]|uniref:transcriptional regulator n=1 Tax=Pasteurella sp. PK-2025 TaxID=3413133 RepID=UPI003C785AC6